MKSAPLRALFLWCRSFEKQLRREPTAIATLKELNIPAEFAARKEGSAAPPVAACAVKNNCGREPMQKFAGYPLSAGARQETMEYANAIPVNSKVGETQAVQAKIGKMEQSMKDLNTVDWNPINEKSPDRNKHWNRMGER